LQAPLVAPSFLPQHPEVGPREPEPSSRATHQGRTRSGGPKRLPPTGPICNAPGFRLERGLPGRHWCPDSRRGPASDTLSRPASPNARPKPRAGFHRSVWATCRLPTSAAEHPPSTPPICPNLATSCDGEPSRDKWQRPLRSTTNRVASGQGSLWLFGPFDPLHDDRSPRRIYPNLTDSDTHCRNPVPRRTRKPGTLRRPCGNGLSRTEPPSKPRRSVTCLVGPPPARSRERTRSRPHPGCLPSPRLPVTGKRPPPPLDESRGLGHPTPLLPTSTPSLTGLASRWLDHPERLEDKNPAPKGDRSALGDFCVSNSS
jgi:hypothetical protein